MFLVALASLHAVAQDTSISEEMALKGHGVLPFRPVAFLTRVPRLKASIPRQEIQAVGSCKSKEGCHQRALGDLCSAGDHVRKVDTWRMQSVN